jgi:hypothetical protein
MVKKLVLVLALICVTVPAFAGYSSQYNKRGTGYYRDNSNDGYSYNNANSLGMNNGRSGRSSARSSTGSRAAWL